MVPVAPEAAGGVGHDNFGWVACVPKGLGYLDLFMGCLEGERWFETCHDRRLDKEIEI